MKTKFFFVLVVLAIITASFAMTATQVDAAETSWGWTATLPVDIRHSGTYEIGETTVPAEFVGGQCVATIQVDNSTMPSINVGNNIRLDPVAIWLDVENGGDLNPRGFLAPESLHAVFEVANISSFGAVVTVQCQRPLPPPQPTPYTENQQRNECRANPNNLEVWDVIHNPGESDWECGGVEHFTKTWDDSVQIVEQHDCTYSWDGSQWVASCGDWYVASETVVGSCSEQVTSTVEVYTCPPATPLINCADTQFFSVGSVPIDTPFDYQGQTWLVTFTDGDYVCKLVEQEPVLASEPTECVKRELVTGLNRWDSGLDGADIYSFRIMPNDTVEDQLNNTDPLGPGLDMHASVSEEACRMTWSRLPEGEDGFTLWRAASDGSNARQILVDDDPIYAKDADFGDLPDDLILATSTERDVLVLTDWNGTFLFVSDEIGFTAEWTYDNRFVYRNSDDVVQEGRAVKTDGGWVLEFGNELFPGSLPREDNDSSEVFAQGTLPNTRAMDLSGNGSQLVADVATEAGGDRLLTIESGELYLIDDETKVEVIFDTASTLIHPDWRGGDEYSAPEMDFAETETVLAQDNAQTLVVQSPILADGSTKAAWVEGNEVHISDGEVEWTLTDGLNKHLQAYGLEGLTVVQIESWTSDWVITLKLSDGTIIQTDQAPSFVRLVS